MLVRKERTYVIENGVAAYGDPQLERENIQHITLA